MAQLAAVSRFLEEDCDRILVRNASSGGSSLIATGA